MEAMNRKRDAMQLAREKLNEGKWVRIEDLRDDDSSPFRWRVSWKRS